MPTKKQIDAAVDMLEKAGLAVETVKIKKSVCYFVHDNDDKDPSTEFGMCADMTACELVRFACGFRCGWRVGRHEFYEQLERDVMHTTDIWNNWVEEYPGE